MTLERIRTGVITDPGIQQPVKLPSIKRTVYIPQVERLALLGQIIHELHEYELDKDAAFWIRLAIDEAVINAITHGHGDEINIPKSPVRIDYVIDAGTIAVRVTDTGYGFDPARVPDPTSEENLYTITGRGIFLMRKAMDSVTYNNIGNSVLMVRKLCRQ
jgi:anti-sigma regulatory factor (Ser/Thr protein kinase)